MNIPTGDGSGAPLPQGTVLALKVSLTDQAGFASADGGDLPDVEKMRDLRVVITSKDAGGTECVEFNRYLDFSDASEKWRYKYGYVDDDRLMFKLTDTNPEKHVYLFANCEPLFTAEKINHPDPENGIYGDVGANKDKKPIVATAYIERLPGADLYKRSAAGVGEAGGRKRTERHPDERGVRHHGRSRKYGHRGHIRP